MVGEDEKRQKLLVERLEGGETLMSGLKQLALRWVAAEGSMHGRRTGNEEALVVGVGSHWSYSVLLRSPAPVGLPGIVVWLTCL